MRSQLNSASTRRRPAAPKRAARSGSPQSALTAAASASGSPGGTRTPVSPSTTTSGMPPTRLATTAVPQAIASRLMSPKGSYTDGQTNTPRVAVELHHVVVRQHGIDPADARPARHRRGEPRLELGRVGARRAEHQLDVGGKVRGRLEQREDPLLLADAADEEHVRRADPVAIEGVAALGAAEARRRRRHCAARPRARGRRGNARGCPRASARRPR